MRRYRLIPLFLPLALTVAPPAVIAAEKDKNDKAKAVKERRLEQQRQRYKSMPAEKRKQLRSVKEKYQKLPADQKRKLREKYQQQQQKKKQK